MSTVSLSLPPVPAEGELLDIGERVERRTIERHGRAGRRLRGQHQRVVATGAGDQHPVAGMHRRAAAVEVDRHVDVAVFFVDDHAVVVAIAEDVQRIRRIVRKIEELSVPSTIT